MSSYPSITGMQALQLLTIHACLTVPIYAKTGAPIGITFISRPFEEDKLLKIDMPLNRARKPESYLKITSKTVSKMLKYSSKKINIFFENNFGKIYLSLTTKVFNVIALATANSLVLGINPILKKFKNKLLWIFLKITCFDTFNVFDRVFAQAKRFTKISSSDKCQSISVFLIDLSNFE
jgi:hypothetical protein